MDGIFSDASTDSIEKFFARLIVYDVAMPHTKTRLSPITFSEFLIRNSILCINQYQVYDAANKFWRRYLDLTPGLLDMIPKPYDMSVCEEEHPGWNKLIDYFNRILDVQKFEGNKYYQMHYLSHVCYLFYQETFKNSHEQCCMRTIFNEVVAPILYEPIIKVASYTWMPVLNFADMRFDESVVTLCARVSGFIETHSGRLMNHQNFDVSRLQSLQHIVNEGLHGIYDNKYNGDHWKTSLVNCISKASILKADMELCELHDSFARDGMKCCRAFDILDKCQNHYEKNLFDDDPDGAIDELLDVYSALKKGLESYNLSGAKQGGKSDESNGS